MEKDLKWIKKHYGEKTMHLCRELFPKLLETDGLLPKILEEHFDRSKSLADDIDEDDVEEDFKNFVFSFAKEEEKIQTKVPKASAKTLFSRAGYILYPECKTEEEIQSFRKYYEDGEELCTFRGGRLTTCRVWFAVKKDVDKILRKNFKNPSRQDEYGTSVISIQVSKGSSVLSIKNRYNHSVKNPDNTFNSDLDNIIEGLSGAFERDYNVKFLNSDYELELFDYVNINGRFYHYNHEINNIYYCDNNTIIDNFHLIKLPQSQMLVEYFIVDFQNKKISTYDSKIEDCLCQSIGKIKDIYFKDNVLTFKVEEGDDVVLKLDSKRNIVSYVNPNLVECGDNFLYCGEKLKEIALPNLQRCGHNFLAWNEELVKADFANLQSCGDDFISSNDKLKNLYMPKLEMCGYGFFDFNKKLKERFSRQIKEAEEREYEIN